MPAGRLRSATPRIEPGTNVTTDSELAEIMESAERSRRPRTATIDRIACSDMEMYTGTMRARCMHCYCKCVHTYLYKLRYYYYYYYMYIIIVGPGYKCT
jgi:hypothetical protein